MQVILEEARESYNHEIIWELENNTVDQMEKNAEKIIDWYQNYHNF